MTRAEPETPDPIQQRWVSSPVTRRWAPWIALALVAAFVWRAGDPTRFLPADPGRDPMGYGDMLEITWGLQWYYDALILQTHDLGVYPQTFAPDGWQVGTLPQGPAVFIPFLPIVALGGVALAYNSLIWVAFALAYAGTYQFARRYLTWPWAIAVGLLASFWCYRWMRIGGHPNIVLGGAMLPWMLWCIEKAQARTPRAGFWVLGAGALWGFAINCSLYFIWIGAVGLAGWSLGRWASLPRNPKRLVAQLSTTALIAVALGLPTILWFREATAVSSSAGFGLDQLSSWGASLNSVATPFVRHPVAWARQFTDAVYQGSASESGTVSLGPVAIGLAIIGLWAARRRRRWWPVVMLTVFGMVLALGPYLRWNDQLVQWDNGLLSQIHAWLWSLGHAVKPQVFAPPLPPTPYDHAIPLPAIVPLILVPTWEGARISARYALVGSIGVYLLAIWVTSRVSRRWIQIMLGAALLFEWLPAPTFGVPFPVLPHPVFAWVREHTPPEARVADVFASAPDRVELRVKPQILTATLFHARAALSGTGSVLPGHAVALQDWLLAHPAPFANPEFKSRLLVDQVGVVLIHVINPETQAVVDALATQTDWTFVGCFDPAPEMTPWPYPICVATP